MASPGVLQEGQGTNQRRVGTKVIQAECVVEDGGMEVTGLGREGRRKYRHPRDLCYLIQWLSVWRRRDRQDSLLTVLLGQLLNQMAGHAPKPVPRVHQQLETLQAVTLLHKEVQSVLKRFLELGRRGAWVVRFKGQLRGDKLT